MIQNPTVVTTKAPPPSGSDDTVLGNPPGWWGMVFLIFTEAALFASLLLAYFYNRSNAPVWPPLGIDKPDLVLPLIMTGLLLASSLTMVIAERGISSGSQATLIIGVAVSVILAVVFLGLQIYEYSEKPFELGDNTYSSAFYTITGLHGIHVAIAVLMGLYLLLRSTLGHFTQRHHEAVRVISLYWHFVDVVWLFVLATLYISPHVL